MPIDCIHVIDFEGHARYGVVEYGVVTLTSKGIQDCQTRLCAPIGEIPPADVRVHGISQADAVGRQPFAADFGLFVSLRQSGLFCAHNAVVESNLLRQTWARPPFSPDWLHPAQTVADWGPWLDTLKLARACFPERDGHALGELTYSGELQKTVRQETALYCPMERNRPHAALFDALATAIWLRDVVGFAQAVQWFHRDAGDAQGEWLF